MKETTPMAGKLIPPTLNKRMVYDIGPKQTASQEMERTPANEDKSPPKKRNPLSKPSTLESADLFDASTAAVTVLMSKQVKTATLRNEVTSVSREVSMLLSKFAHVLRERAATDTSQMKELEGILAEAHNLESYLKEKKNHLRQTLALISDKLQG